MFLRNRKNSLYCLLLVVFTINTQPAWYQKRQYVELSWVALAAWFSAASYLATKVVAKYIQGTLLDTPLSFQQWARSFLAEKGLKNVNAILLKMGSGWGVKGGSFIQVDSCDVKKFNTVLLSISIKSEQKQKEIRAIVEESLLHEARHYCNGDGSKGRLFYAVTVALLVRVIIGKYWFRKKKNWLECFAAIGFGIVPVISYFRYQEHEADRYAFMNMPLESLEISKKLCQRGVGRFETNLAENSLEGNFLVKKIIPVLSKKLNVFNQELVHCCDKPEQILWIQSKRRGVIEVASFLCDLCHPSYQSRFELAQECFKKRTQAGEALKISY